MLYFRYFKAVASKFRSKISVKISILTLERPKYYYFYIEYNKPNHKMPYLNLLFLTFIVVFIVDLSGFIESVKEGLSRVLTKFLNQTVQINRIKPFDCSLCMSFWVGLIYLTANHNLSIPTVAFLSLLSFSTRIIGEATQSIYYKILNHL